MEIIIPYKKEKYSDYIKRILNNRENIKDENVYQERHHITPKCLGGSNDKDNLIYLYAQEHYYAHKLLALENPNENGLQYAWWNMCQCSQNNERIYNISSEDYYISREKFSNMMKNNDYAKNNKLSDSTRQKMRESHIGKFDGENNPMYGKHCTDHCKALLSEQLSGGKNPAARKVRCIETGDIFDCMNDAGIWCGLKGKRPGSTIGACIEGKQNSAGKHPITREKLHWEYIE